MCGVSLECVVVSVFAPFVFTYFGCFTSVTWNKSESWWAIVVQWERKWYNSRLSLAKMSPWYYDGLITYIFSLSSLLKEVPANTSVLCLSTTKNIIYKKIIIIHCTETISSVCKQVYWAAFCLHVAVLLSKNVCSSCIGIKSRWLASASCHMFNERFYRKQIAPFSWDWCLFLWL